MNITRFEPWSLFDALQRDVDRMAGRRVGYTATDDNGHSVADWVPAVDIVEEKSIRLKLLSVPFGHFEPERSAQQGLSRAQSMGWAGRAMERIESGHRLLVCYRRECVREWVAGLDEHGIAFSAGADVK